jgi:hypothetical protein
MEVNFMDFKEEEIKIDEVVRAFHMMWGDYPSPVTLIKKDRTVVAVNKASQLAGGTAGVKCFQQNGTMCPWCKGNEMFKTGVAVRDVIKAYGIVFDSYWIPTPIKDLCIHFGNDITEWAKPEI